jgi:hypothetical protein
MSRGVWRWVVVVAVAACSGDELSAVGDQCTRSGQCADPYVCALGRCRVECVETGDCLDGFACVAQPGGAGVCTLDREEECAATSDCPAPLLCEAGHCRNECRVDADCDTGERCDATVCVAPDDAGDGTDAGPPDAVVPDASLGHPSLCASDDDCDAPDRCLDFAGLRMCREPCERHEDCAPNRVCDYYYEEPVTDAGLVEVDACSVDCVPGTDQGCPTGLACVHGAYTRDVQLGFTACVLRGDGAACATCEWSNNCLSGNCEGPDGAKVCRDYCLVGTSCAGGAACQPFNPRVERTEGEYGSCPCP